MKNIDLYHLKQGLDSVGGLTGIKFAYAVAKNLRLVATEISVLDELRVPSEAFAEYEKERIALCEQHSEKDEDGKPRMANGGANGVFTFAIANKAAFEAELDELRTQHATAIKERDDQMRRCEEFLQEESDLDLHSVKLDDVPKEISAGQMSAILEIVRDEV